jgi:hypothetical protein
MPRQTCADPRLWFRVKRWAEADALEPRCGVEARLEVVEAFGRVGALPLHRFAPAAIRKRTIDGTMNAPQHTRIGAQPAQCAQCAAQRRTSRKGLPSAADRNLNTECRRVGSGLYHSRPNHAAAVAVQCSAAHCSALFTHGEPRQDTQCAETAPIDSQIPRAVGRRMAPIFVYILFRSTLR